MIVRVPIRRVAGPGAAFALPSYATDDAAGVDLVAAIGAPLVVQPLARVRVPTGIAIALPRGYEGQVRPRSGLAWRLGLTVLNAPGTIDADYRGEVQVILVNVSERAVAIEPGDRIAQLVVAPVTRVAWDQRAELDETARGDGGFGHTGQ
ncbi:MAG: dUTP diphosphatase [Deltaproteobacteria bacterium]|nr:dUTP diphosphatase [Deltaproteobacteria bacterium]